MLRSESARRTTTGNAYYGDPAFVKVPLGRMLSKTYGRERRALIGRQAALDHRSATRIGSNPDVKRPAVRYRPHAQAPIVQPRQVIPRASTSSIKTQSDSVRHQARVGARGAFVAGDTGVPCDRMQVFDPMRAERPGRRKRPRTTLTPTLLLKVRTVFLAISTPAGQPGSADPERFGCRYRVRKGPPDAIEAPRINSLHPQQLVR